jgi:outer membrane protein OmpA-like peptidoglycan-associated protein
MKIRNASFMALPLAAVLAVPAFAQTSQVQNPPASQSTQPATSTPGTSTDAQKPQSDAVAQPVAEAKQPLQLETKQGFWGKLNPFARKKYVQRQMQPVVGRVNELDELTAENAKMIRDVDSRATEGIRMASLKVNEADNKAIEAGNRANLAHQTATQANTRLDTIQKQVETIDQYQPVSDTEIRFRPGQAILSSKAKAALDEIAQPLKNQKGYVVEVQGFSSGTGRAAIENSQRMAEAVVRYLVIEHEIPVYRIFTVGMGNVPAKPAADGTKARRITGGRVEISLLRNGISDLQAQSQQQPAQQQQQQQQQQQ